MLLDGPSRTGTYSRAVFLYLGLSFAAKSPVWRNRLELERTDGGPQRREFSPPKTGHTSDVMLWDLPHESYGLRLIYMVESADYLGLLGLLGSIVDGPSCIDRFSGQAGRETVIKGLACNL